MLNFKKDREFESKLEPCDVEVRHSVKKENRMVMILTATHAAALTAAHTLTGAIAGDCIGFVIADTLEDAFPKTFGFGSSNYCKAFGLTKAACTITGTSVGLSQGIGELKLANNLCKERLLTYDKVFVDNVIKKYDDIEDFVDVEIREEK